MGVGPPTESKTGPGLRTGYKVRPDPDNQRGYNLVTSDLEKAALIGRQVNRMEEVGSLIFQAPIGPGSVTLGHKGAVSLELLKVFIILGSLLLLAIKPNPNQALSGLWYNRHFPKQQARLIHTLHPLL